MRRLLPISLLLLLVLPSCRISGRLDRHTRLQLEEVDAYLAQRDKFVQQKENQLDAMRSLLSRYRADESRYDMYMSLGDEYFAFSFDSTQRYYSACIDLASQMGDPDRYNQACIKLGHLYAKSGHYVEAYTRLYGQIDTSGLSEERKTEYLLALFDFSRDLSGNSGMAEQLAIPDRDVYRRQLYRRLEEDSNDWLLLKLDESLRAGNFEKADSLGQLLIAATPSSVHDYAKYAFELAEIASHQGDRARQMEWLVKSAECDISLAIRDYASLTMIAQNILPVDVDHSFSYLRIAQEDAIRYNAKLRPWQISRFLLEVEHAYGARQEELRNSQRIGFIVLAVMVAILSVLTWFLVRRSRKLNRMRSELEKVNRSLESANITINDRNRQISKADQVKGKYILAFLQGLSGQISLLRQEDNHFRNLIKQGKSDVLLKELSISGRSEKARDEFYETFDHTFLAMYPDFVEQFNALLREEARIYPPKDRLTTELRIFALILLGVDDSKQIAAMLDYSVSTIYNYKVAVKNAALGERDNFEIRVKQIGK